MCSPIRLMRPGDFTIMSDCDLTIILLKVINLELVSSKKVMSPAHVRYGWKNWFAGTLFNSEGLPASSFSSM